MKTNALLIRFASLSTMIFLPIINVTSCSGTNNNINDNVDDNEIVNIDPDMIFPKLYLDNFYDYVEFDNKANPFFGDKFIYAVIDDVLNRVSTVEGKIKFRVKRYSQSSIEFNFLWTYNDYKLYKSYSFEI